MNNSHIAEPFCTALESWRNLQPGARVRCIDHPLAKSTAGKFGTFVEFTPTHGYARVDIDASPNDADQTPVRWLIHPEALEVGRA